MEAPIVEAREEETRALKARIRNSGGASTEGAKSESVSSGGMVGKCK